MKKSLSVFILLVAVTFVFVTFKQIKVDASANNFDPNIRSIDMGLKLREEEQNPLFQQQALETIKKNAEEINFAEGETTDPATNDGNFTYNGGIKYFLGINLEFIDFTLRSVGDNVEVWVANDLSYGYDRSADVVTQAQVDMLRDEFENNIYPTDTGFFGKEDTHDGTNSLLEQFGYVPEGYYSDNSKNIILVENIKDDSYYSQTPFYTAGFYWNTIENYTDRNIVTLDSAYWYAYMPNDNPAWEQYQYNLYGTLAHEYQHLIHADNDKYEETWINEGMSDFAQYLCGYGHNWGHVNYYLEHPENSLVEWGDYNGSEILADYGQAYLLQLYLYDHYGQEFIRDLAVNTDQGAKSVTEVLEAYNAGIDFNELFQRFTIAVAIDSENPSNGIYNFDSIDLQGLNYNLDKEGIRSYGPQFTQLDISSKIDKIIVDNSTYWQSIDFDGEDVLWSNVGNGLDNKLILNADLRNLDAATLEFDHQMNIEEGWDYAFVQISTDNGHTWTSLSNNDTSSNFVDNEDFAQIANQKVGFSGLNEEWTHEKFDLSQFAGQKVLISFRNMTDGYSNGNSDEDGNPIGTITPGWYIDNISIPEINYYNDGSSFNGLTFDEQYANEYVFINEKVLPNGEINYKIVTAEEYNSNDLQLRQLFKDGTNYMISWHENPYGNTTLPFDYEIITKK